MSPNEAGNTEAGSTVIEYAVLISLIAIVCIVSLSNLGGTISTSFNQFYGGGGDGGGDNGFGDPDDTTPGAGDNNPPSE